MSSLPFPTQPPRLDDPVSAERRPFLGSILLKRGRVTQQRLDAALNEVERTGRRLGDVLLERGWLYESELAQALADQHGLDFVDISARGADPKLAGRFPRDFAEYFRAVPVRTLSSGTTLVAVVDPSDVDVEVLKIVLGTDVTIVIGELSAIKEAWRYCCP